VSRIHRFCACETLDNRRWSPASATTCVPTRESSLITARLYGCDVDTPPQRIVADHLDIVKPTNRSAAPYTFFAQVYRAHPILDVVRIGSRQQTVRPKCRLQPHEFRR